MYKKLVIDSVYAEYKHHIILTDVYLELSIGDIIGLFGRNGSGKTTLLQIIFGIITPKQKQLRVDGQIINRAYLINGLIAYLPQHYFLPGHLKLKQAMGLSLDGTAIHQLNNNPIIYYNLHQKIRSLSGGERRYIEILITLHLNTTFVLLDEPFTQLSPVLIEDIQQHILRASLTKGIIITDHQHHYVHEICTSGCLLYNGYLQKQS